MILRQSWHQLLFVFCLRVNELFIPTPLPPMLKFYVGKITCNKPHLHLLSSFDHITSLHCRHSYLLHPNIYPAQLTFCSLTPWMYFAYITRCTIHAMLHTVIVWLQVSFLSICRIFLYITPFTWPYPFRIYFHFLSGLLGEEFFIRWTILSIQWAYSGRQLSLRDW